MSEVVARIDDFGRPAWIALMVIGFIVFWPIGLAILAYIIWSGRMGCSARYGDMQDWRDRAMARWERKRERWERHMQRWGDHRGSGHFAPTGNRAFDEYRERGAAQAGRGGRTSSAISWSGCAWPRTARSSTSS